MAGKIPARDLIAQFQRMYKERWKYIWGKAEKGCVDCSGAFVYAYRKFGKTIAHGSNTIARNAVVKLLPVRQARPGMAALKIREPGDPKYDLPAKFRKGGPAYNGDLNDYYHIGLVDESGRYVLNAQGENAGFTRTKISLWSMVGYLRAVDYGKGEGRIMSETYTGVATVCAERGKTVNVRTAPNGSKQAALPVGTEVEITETKSGWCKVIYPAAGWMMKRFLSEGRD